MASQGKSHSGCKIKLSFKHKANELSEKSDSKAVSKTTKKRGSTNSPGSLTPVVTDQLPNLPMPYHKAWGPCLNSFLHSFIPQNAFTPQIEKQRIWNQIQRKKGHMTSLSTLDGMHFCRLLPKTSWLCPLVLSLPVLSSIGSSWPVVLGFLSRMKMGLHPCSKRSSWNLIPISLFTCRHQSKKRQWSPCGMLWMSLTLIWKITRQQKRYVFHIISVGLILNFLKVKLDDTIEEIVTKLSNKYPPGLCELHSDLPCFHPSNLHFNLDCSQLLVWAQAIKSGTSSATYEKVPILSPMFKVSLALKHALKDATNTNTSPTSAQGQMSPPRVWTVTIDTLRQ